ncbi:MAG: hypothetical protein PHS04_00930 [Tissierellia bacterium]|nr:hypothetical protein [Fermentimonas sp.]MDD4436581.1 hypothetical protein [Tissierellia bacterium]
MSGERIDSLDKYYKQLNFIDLVCTVLFWLNASVSILIFFLNGYQVVREVLTYVFIVTTVMFFIADNYLSIYLIPSVEGKRRVHLISKSLDVPLDYEITQKYYNNDIEPSITKLGAHIFENSLFAKEVTVRMCSIERRKILFYAAIWIVSLTIRTVDLEFIAIISQTLFASTLLTKWLKLEYLRIKNEQIYNCLYDLFLLRRDNDDARLSAKFLDCFVSYEAAKAYSGIKQSSKIFFEINDTYTEEWERIKEKLEIK